MLFLCWMCAPGSRGAAGLQSNGTNMRAIGSSRRRRASWNPAKRGDFRRNGIG